MIEQDTTSRRNFLTASVAATTALVGQQVLPRIVHAAESDELKVALVGCGGGVRVPLRRSYRLIRVSGCGPWRICFPIGWKCR